MTKVASLICGLILILGLVHSTSAKTFIVGDNQGWSLDADLKAWLKGKTFHEGDDLVFKYPLGFQPKRTTREEYEECNAGGSGGSFWDTGLEITTLVGKGDYYFISTASEICKAGLKMKLTVV